MAFSHGKDGVVLIHGVNLTPYFRKFSPPRSVDTADVSMFGDQAHKYLVGQSDGTFSGEGLFDGAIGANDETLAAVLQGQDKIVSYFPAGDAKGSAGHAGLADETSYETTVAIGDAVGVKFDAQASGGIERVISLLSKSTSIVATGNQAIQDDGAASANGGSAYVHTLSKVGGTSATVTLRHSTDNFGASDVLLATFTAQSAAGVAERLALVGTINRYVRAVVTLGSGGTWTFSVALHRN